MGQFGRVADCCDLETLATDNDRVTVYRYVHRQRAVNGVIFQQVSISFDWPEVIYGNDFDVGPAVFQNGAKHVPPDTTETIDCYTHCHF